MPKLAIYVPKKEMRVIEKWRKKINFSQVFMRALMREIDERSRTARRARGDIAAAAAYYSRKLVEDSPKLRDFGEQLGTRHILTCRLAPETIRGLVKLGDAETLSPQQILMIEEAIGSDLAELEKLARKEKIDTATHPAWRIVVYRGYLTGIADTWRQICQRMYPEDDQR